MKTRPTTANPFTGIQWFTTFVGVVIAITCSFVLLSNFNQRHEERKRPTFRNGSTSIIVSNVATAASGVKVKSLLEIF